MALQGQEVLAAVLRLRSFSGAHLSSCMCMQYSRRTGGSLEGIHEIVVPIIVVGRWLQRGCPAGYPVCLNQAC